MIWTALRTIESSRTFPVTKFSGVACTSSRLLRGHGFGSHWEYDSATKKGINMPERVAENFILLAKTERCPVADFQGSDDM